MACLINIDRENVTANDTYPGFLLRTSLLNKSPELNLKRDTRSLDFNFSV